VAIIGRERELGEVGRLLERAGAGHGGTLVLAGAAGSGRTTLTEAAADMARQRGFQLLRAGTAAPTAVTGTGGAAGSDGSADGEYGRWVWAGLLRAAGAADGLIARVLAGPAPLDLDAAAEVLCAGPRLILIDDVDQAGAGAAELLAILAGRAPAHPVAVIATSLAPLDAGPQLWLGPLSVTDIGAVTGEERPQVRHALWTASRGLPGPARSLAAVVADLPPDADPVVQLALRAESAEGFLVIDSGLVSLVEMALQRPTDDRTRARLLARLAHELLGDAAAASRRRNLIAEATGLTRRCADPAVLAEVLDAQLHALWDAAGAEDRLAAAGEIVGLARSTADLARERRGLFWRFVALMELGRVAEAETALATFERAARAAGDGDAIVMATARHAMLATLRGRFDEAHQLADQVVEQGQRAGLADTRALAGTIRGIIALLRGEPPVGGAGLQELRETSRRVPGHLHEATAARVLLAAGDTGQAALELERALPLVLAGSGPRWLAAATDLAAVAAGTGSTAAAAALDEVLAGYRGRLVVWAGANTVTGPVGHYLGLLAAQLDRPDDAVDLLAEAAILEERIGALPWLALTLAALADVLARRNAGDDLARSANQRSRAQAIASQLGMTGLLASLSPPADEWALRRNGDGWLLTAGDEQARLPDTRGLQYLRALLATPNRDVTALDLVAGGAGLAASSAEPLLDRAGQDAYRRHLAALDTELDAADRSGDRERASRAEAERQAVLAGLSRASGLGGRPRRITAEDERARVNVTRTLRLALGQISAVVPKAGAHLAASIRTGRACRYEPVSGGPARWHL
jgi:hypothetical protein